MYKLLIADDELLERQAIRYIAAERFADEFEIREAANGREAVEIALDFEPDIAFLDIKMPGLNGLEAAAQIRQALPDCQFAIISAYHHFSYAKEAVTLGATQYITKPVPVEELARVLRRVTLRIDETRAHKQQEAETAKRLQQVTQYLQEELLLLIALGEVEERVIQEYFAIFDLDYKAFLFANLTIEAEETMTEIERTIRKKQAVEEIKTMIRSYGHDCLIGGVGQDIYVLLLLNGETEEYGVRIFSVELFSRIKEQIAQELGLALKIGISNYGEDLANMYPAFLQAKFAVNYDQTPGAVVSYGDIHKGESPSTYPINKEKLLRESMVQGAETQALRLLDEIIDWLAFQTEGLEALRQKIYELLLVLVREVVINSNLSEVNLDEGELRAVFLQEDGRELRAFAKRLIAAKIGEIHRIKVSRANSLLTKAVEYLEEHYAQEVSLEEVAEFIQISPFYLSKLFKKELGENFSDYLTAIRMKKAKEILVDPLSNIKEASYKVGYKDPNYFARAFKKSFGLTPSEYKAKFVIHGTKDPNRIGRIAYDLDGFRVDVRHVAVRETTSDNPFIPHEHAEKELWYIVSGSGYFLRGANEERVGEGDLIQIDSWVKHGLRTETKLTWVVLSAENL